MNSILTDGMEDETEMINYETYIEMRKDQWKEYQGSGKRYELKNKALKRSNFMCEIIGCHMKKKLEMHHDKYPERPELDCLENVRILCRGHHQIVSDGKVNL